MLSSGEAPCFLTSELSEEQSQNIGAFLDLLKCDQLDKMSYAIQMLMNALEGQ